MSSPVTLAVLGAGNVGAALARQWIAAGHTVHIGVPDPAHNKREIPAGAKLATVPEAAGQASVVVLCVPWEAAEDAVRSVSGWSGKILVDCTNPLLPDLSALVIGTSTSAGEMVQKWAPEAKVVKAFNTIGAANYGNAQFGDQRADGFYCGDDAASKLAVQPLIEAVGLDPVDVGPLRNSRSLESLALLWIDLAVNQKQGPNHGFKLLRR